jgi:putative membrane protein
MKLHRLIGLTAALAVLQATAVWGQFGGQHANSQDVCFLRQAALLGLYQFELGQLAMSLGPTQDIRDYGLQEAADHSGINRQLRELAESLGINVLTSLPRNQERVLDRFAALADTDSERFVRALLKESIRTHRQSIQLFAKEARQGDDPAVTDFAQRFRGMLRQHLDDALELRSNL